MTVSEKIKEAINLIRKDVTNELAERYKIIEKIKDPQNIDGNLHHQYLTTIVNMGVLAEKVIALRGLYKFMTDNKDSVEQLSNVVDGIKNSVPFGCKVFDHVSNYVRPEGYLSTTNSPGIQQILMEAAYEDFHFIKVPLIGNLLERLRHNNRSPLQKKLEELSNEITTRSRDIFVLNETVNNIFIEFAEEERLNYTTKKAM